jgi:hypothetical protein
LGKRKVGQPECALNHVGFRAALRSEQCGPGKGSSNSKHQITNPKQIPITKKAMTETSLFGIWPLKIIWCSVLGIWCFYAFLLRLGSCDFEGIGV